MLAGLQCARLLATESLVHRDLRLANFFWDRDKPFVGDLELAAKAPLQVPLLADVAETSADMCCSYAAGGGE